jgi:hypothetical protein
VLRGGSWNNNQNNARCAYRNRNNPHNRNNNNGFRLVSHISSQPAMPRAGASQRDGITDDESGCVAEAQKNGAACLSQRDSSLWEATHRDARPVPLGPEAKRHRAHIE